MKSKFEVRSSNEELTNGLGGGFFILNSNFAWMTYLVALIGTIDIVLGEVDR